MWGPAETVSLETMLQQIAELLIVLQGATSCLLIGHSTEFTCPGF